MNEINNTITKISLIDKNPVDSSIDRCVNYFLNRIEISVDDLDCYIAGGCMRSYFAKEPINDIDLFFKDRKNAVKCLIRLRKVGYRLIFSNKNAVKLVKYEKDKKSKSFIDIVKRYYNSAEETILDFDFSVCKIAYDTKTKQFYHSKNSFVDICTKKLAIPDINYGNPIGSLKRFQKYIKNGYYACNGTILTIAKSINSIDMNSPEFNEIEFYPDGRVKILLFD